MNLIGEFYRSTIGKKIIMAMSGLVWIGFLVAHMAGNLQTFLGPEKLNAYGALLHGPAAELLWLARLVLIAAIVLHVLMAVQLAARTRAARPIGYEKRNPQVSTLASRTMLAGGILLLVFLILHILHFTTLDVDPAGWGDRVDEAGRRDVYGNVVASFRIWWVAAFYVVAMIAVGFHLFHGAWASLRTLGYARPSPNPLRRKVALGLAVIVWLGFTLVPLGVVAGVIR